MQEVEKVSYELKKYYKESATKSEIVKYKLRNYEIVAECWESLVKNEKVWKSVLKAEKVWESVLKAEKVF